ncbi:hypothetical protein B0H11DRAFT_1920927 [Mycena galericulata]|nr:hypothetical protein B0H11DRAFT_1920927 [Mycena galericulata]
MTPTPGPLLGLMMGGVINLTVDVPFNPSYWIGAGKTYKDVPTEVSDAFSSARQLPPDLEATLPGPTMLSILDPVNNSLRAGSTDLGPGDHIRLSDDFRSHRSTIIFPTLPLWREHYERILNRPNKEDDWALCVAYDTEVRRRRCVTPIDPSVFHLAIWNEVEPKHIARKTYEKVRAEFGKLVESSQGSKAHGASSSRYHPYLNNSGPTLIPSRQIIPFITTRIASRSRAHAPSFVQRARVARSPRLLPSSAPTTEEAAKRPTLSACSTGCGCVIYKLEGKRKPETKGWGGRRTTSLRGSSSLSAGGAQWDTGGGTRRTRAYIARPGLVDPRGLRRRGGDEGQGLTQYDDAQLARRNQYAGCSVTKSTTRRYEMKGRTMGQKARVTTPTPPTHAHPCAATPHASWGDKRKPAPLPPPNDTVHQARARPKSTGDNAHTTDDNAHTNRRTPHTKIKSQSPPPHAQKHGGRICGHTLRQTTPPPVPSTGAKRDATWAHFTRATTRGERDDARGKQESARREEEDGEGEEGREGSDERERSVDVAVGPPLCGSWSGRGRDLARTPILRKKSHAPVSQAKDSTASTYSYPSAAVEATPPHNVAQLGHQVVCVHHLDQAGSRQRRGHGRGEDRAWEQVRDAAQVVLHEGRGRGRGRAVVRVRLRAVPLVEAERIRGISYPGGA